MTFKKAIFTIFKRRRFITAVIPFVVVAAFLGGMLSPAQNREQFKARLAPAPPLGMRASAVAGLGSASATLSGRRLTITGTFERMASPATVAHLGIGPVTGARGDAIFDLTVVRGRDGNPPGTSGTIRGNFDLTSEQVDALRKGRLYIQIHSEGAPNGHLLGWLLR